MITQEHIRNVKVLLGFSTAEVDDDLEAKIRFALQTAQETILNYCHLEEVPSGLNVTMYRMALDVYRNEQLGSDEVSTVKSVTVGDTSTSFGGVASDYAQSLLKDYEMSLRQYRRVVFH